MRESSVFDFSKRVLLLTGAGGGIGRAVAQEFIAAGARVVLADLDEKAPSAPPRRAIRAARKPPW
jgi:NAD(P)-dependent dehydrogenase (short-subunit alcohol dehydrogenase family)